MGLKVDGLGDLIGTLKDNVTMNDVRFIVKKNGTDLTRKMKEQTKIAYIKGYSTGDTAGSINMKLTNGGLTAEVQASTAYVQYVEYGTRFMSPEPIVQPSLEVVGAQFLRDLSRVTK